MPTYSDNDINIAKLEMTIISECQKIYFEAKKSFEEMSDKVWILHNSRLGKDSGTDKKIEKSWLLLNGEITTGIQYKGSNFQTFNNSSFFTEPEMHFNIFPDKQTVLLAYYFSKRFARCTEYEITYNDNNYNIGNPNTVWVS